MISFSFLVYRFTSFTDNELRFFNLVLFGTDRRFKFYVQIVTVTVLLLYCDSTYGAPVIVNVWDFP
jgi:hypothetical protein